MDVWPPHERRKRSFADMSHSTLSPSPGNFVEPNSSLFNSQRYLPASNNNSQSSRAGSFFERRRTSHPHNPPLHRPSEGMPERSQSRSHPRLDAQVSIIDLTDDADDRLIFAPVRSRSRRPPQLDRSDAVGFADFIDLTEDGEPDLIITGVQQRRRPEPPARERAERAISPGLFVPLEPQNRNRQSPQFSGRVLGNHANIIGHLGGMGEILGVAHDIMDHVLLFHQGMAGGQPMPNHMDYQANPFVQYKPEHIAPPKPRPGFTRSPTEGDIIICPSCEEEMIHKKDGEEPPLKKGGKAPTKKDREEHPFWVVKDCGHVYCNHCFQNRQTANKGSSTVSFPEIEKSPNGKGRATKTLACAVDGCKSDVKGKDKWVGVFL